MEPIYKCLIVDDEAPAHLVLQSHISKCDELEFTGSAFNGKEALKLLSEQHFDILFLDIEMPIFNGIEVLRTLDKKPVTIITTAYNHFAFDAFQEDAIDYLLKPIPLPRFLKAVEKAKHFYQAERQTIVIPESITLKVDGETIELRLEDITYLQSIGNYIKIYVKGKVKAILVYDALKKMLERLPATLFIQAHKSYVINRTYIERIEKELVYLQGEIAIPVGRRYELLLSRLDRKV